MKKVQIKFVRMYKKQGTGKTVFVYAVSGNKDAVERYAEAKGDNLVIDDDTQKPLWFTTNSVGKSAELTITAEGKMYVDQSEQEMLASQISQLGGNLGKALATEYAKKLVSGAQPSAVVQPKTEEEPEEK